MSDNNGWISVKEKLPKEHGKYLTFGEWDGQFIAIFHYGNWYHDYESEDTIITNYTTHWQELKNDPK